MFKIYVEDFEIEAIIGILEIEREKAQKIIVNLEIDYKLQTEFLDYAKVVELVEEIFVEKRYYLLEDALLEIPEILQSLFNTISKIKLKITKPDIIKNANVSVEIEKSF